MKDTKILFGILGASAILVLGLVFLVSGKEKSEGVLSGLDSKVLEINPSFYNMGNVPINGGIVERVYEIKNSSDKTIRLKKIATSCMCTKAGVEISGKTTTFFGMEMSGDKNPSVNIEIRPGDAGKVITRFDPAAHGPNGTGPFDRLIWLTFSDPAGVKELKFSGTVVK